MAELTSSAQSQLNGRSTLESDKTSARLSPVVRLDDRG